MLACVTQAEVLYGNFSKATMDMIDFTDGVISFSTDMDDVSCINCVFEGAEFEGDLHEEVTMRRINCPSCNFNKAMLEFGILDHGIFINAQLMEVRTFHSHAARCMRCASPIKSSSCARWNVAVNSMHLEWLNVRRCRFTMQA